MTKTQDIVTKKHKIRNILCFLSVVAFSYNKDGGGGESRTHVLRGCQKTFYILSLSTFLKNRNAAKHALRPAGS